MSNQEAITLLRNLEDSLDSYCELNEEGKTAFRMAIEALNCSKFPNNSDTISRQAAIDAMSCINDSICGQQAIDALCELPSAQSDLITKIQNGIKVTNADDVYSCGMRNGMRWCMSLIDGKEPLYENCPSAQPDLDSAYTEGYTAAESKYRAIFDEMQATIKAKAFGKRKGLIHTADIDAMPTIEERKTGKWVDGKCNKCGTHTPY